MSLAFIFGGALAWAFLCTAIALVAASWTHGRPNRWKAAFIGASVGAVFGVAIVYLADAFRIPAYIFRAVAPAQLGGFASAFNAILIAAASGGTTGVAVGALVGRSRRALRRSAAAGVAFGLVLGLANVAVGAAVKFVIIAVLGSVSFAGPSATAFGVATMLCIAIIDTGLAFVAIRYARPTRRAASSAGAS